MMGISHQSVTPRPGRRSEAGQVLVLVALGLTLLLGFAGLGVDIAQMRHVRRMAQAAADAAAIAGAAELLYADVTTAAQTDSASNGFTDGTGGVTVTVSNPPTDGPHVGNSKYVEVIVSATPATFFMKALGITQTTIGARAVATQKSSPTCIYALDPTATNAFKITGSGNITAQCGIMDDSSASQAFDKEGSGALSATAIGVTGGYTETGSGSISPTPVTSVLADPDPLSYLTAPSVGTCTFSSQVSFTGSGSNTVSPGVYCGGIHTSGSGALTFNSGLYIINGGSLNLNGSGAVTGNGVTFYVTNSAFVSFSGSSTVTLTAQTSGTYAGILFFQDRSDTAAATVSGSSTSAISGALYFPKAALNYNGSGPLSSYTILVADTIVINGSSSINDNYSSLPGGVSPIANAVLVE
jgi:Putative Flp pilus-assembly TadE/G-like